LEKPAWVRPVRSGYETIADDLNIKPTDSRPASAA
jgi:hypothetical protein